MRFVWKCGIFYSILYNLIRVGLIWRDFIMRLDLCVGIFSSGSCFVFKTWCFIGVTFCTASCHFFCLFVFVALNFWIHCALPSFALSSLFCWLESNYSPLSFLFSVKRTFRVRFSFRTNGSCWLNWGCDKQLFSIWFILFYSFIISVIKCRPVCISESKVTSLIFFFVQSTLFIYCHTLQGSSSLIILLVERQTI